MMSVHFDFDTASTSPLALIPVTYKLYFFKLKLFQQLATPSKILNVPYLFTEPHSKYLLNNVLSN